jgi:hypothetical protein
VLARRILVVPVLAVALAAAGCGGGDDNGSSGQEKLKIAQANADVLEFCSVAGVGKGDVYDRAYFAMLDAVDTLANAYKNNRDETVNLDQRNHGVAVDKVVRDSAARLAKNCGADGKQQAAKLQQALQQQ